MDPFKLLENDHRRVERLLGQIEKAGESDGNAERRRQLFAELASELEIHEAIEEEILYPQLKQYDSAKELTLEAFEEHHVVDLLLGEMRTLDVEDETWPAKAAVLKENLEHHIEEEEGELFAKARKVLDRQQLEHLGEHMAARKRELQGGKHGSTHH